LYVTLSKLQSNNSFKPKLLRSGNGVAEEACHAVTCATQFGLTLVLGSGKSVWVFRLWLLLRRQLLSSQLVFLACGLLFVGFGRGASESSRSPPARGQQFRKTLGGACRFGCKSLGVALACHINPLPVSLLLQCSLR
jgi:hypothetical protein